MSDFNSIIISTVLQLAALTLIPFIWWLITARKTSFFEWIGLKKPVISGSKLKLILVIIAGAAAYIAVMFFIMSKMMGDTETATSQFAGKGLAAIPSILVYAIIQTSLSEEIFFRGFLCKRLVKKFGFTAGNLMQAFLFGLLHGIPFGMVTGKWYILVLLTIIPAGIGFLQGWMNEKKAAGSIIPSWIMHALMNIMSAVSVI